jgi:hypothetical protein
MLRFENPKKRCFMLVTEILPVMSIKWVPFVQDGQEDPDKIMLKSRSRERLEKLFQLMDQLPDQEIQRGHCNYMVAVQKSFLDIEIPEPEAPQPACALEGGEHLVRFQGVVTILDKEYEYDLRLRAHGALKLSAEQVDAIYKNYEHILMTDERLAYLAATAAAVQNPELIAIDSRVRRGRSRWTAMFRWAAGSQGI